MYMQNFSSFIGNELREVWSVVLSYVNLAGMVFSNVYQLTGDEDKVLVHC